MIITAVEPRKKALSALYIDGEFALNLDTQTLLENGIKKGVELDDVKLKELIEESDFRRAKERALWLLSFRDYSKKELTEKLLTVCTKDGAKKAVERLSQLGLIDDERFARKYCSDLINIKHLSKSSAVYKLMQKGIDRELAQEICDEFEVDPKEQIQQIIEKKYRTKLNDEKDIRRTVAALQRMGYRWGDIKSVIDEYCECEEY